MTSDDSYQVLTPATSAAYVYRIWTVDETCLYVGSTVNLWQRLGTHLSSAQWRAQVDHIDVKGFSSTRDAEWEEFEQASQLQPKHCLRYGKFFPGTPHQLAYKITFENYTPAPDKVPNSPSNLRRHPVPNRIRQPVPDPLLSCEDAASYLGVLPATIRAQRRNWGLTAYRIGRALKFRQSELREWREGQQISA